MNEFYRIKGEPRNPFKIGSVWIVRLAILAASAYLTYRFAR